MPRFAWPLALDEVERGAFASHFDCVGVAELMRRDSAPDTGGDGQAAQCHADG